MTVTGQAWGSRAAGGTGACHRKVAHGLPACSSAAWLSACCFRTWLRHMSGVLAPKEACGHKG